MDSFPATSKNHFTTETRRGRSQESVFFHFEQKETKKTKRSEKIFRGNLTRSHEGTKKNTARRSRNRRK